MSQAERYTQPLPVIAIGGSAGALPALQCLFEALAADTGAAFVVLEHLKADQPSHLVSILSGYTRMPVATIEDGSTLEANHVYVMPPGQEIELAEGRLRVRPPAATRRLPIAIDRFFLSLAAAQEIFPLGVVLSGMGDDGARGLEAIKSAGGVTMVQAPDTAKFPDMPRNAMASHVADHVVDIKVMADTLHNLIANHGYRPERASARVLSDSEALNWRLHRHIQSMSAGHQSAPKDLETSQQELQTLNEELATVNAELRERIAEQERTNNDLINLFSGSRAATLFLDRDLRIRRYTPAVRNLVNLLPSDTGRPLSDLNTKFDDPSLIDDAGDVLEQLHEHESEVRVGERWYTRRIQPYRTLEGVIEGVVINFAEITALKGALAVTRRNEAQLQTLADAFPALVAHVNADMRLDYVNAAYRQWFDSDPRALRGHHLESLFGEQRYRAISSYCEDASAGKAVTYEQVLDTDYLEARTVHIKHIPDASATASRRGFYMVMTDLSTIHEQAEAAHASRVASLTELADTIAHQINQPLGAITTYAGALKNQLADDSDRQSREIVEKLVERARNASEILAELRGFIGQRGFDSEALDVNAVVRRALRLADSQITAIGAEVRLALACRTSPITGARVQLEQVLINLLTNAVQAMEGSRTRRLTIATESDDQYVRVSVADTGPGIPDDECDRIFDTFYTNKRDGMGMGLSISRGIVEELGGALWAATGEKHGAVFHLRLPTADQ